VTKGTPERVLCDEGRSGELNYNFAHGQNEARFGQCRMPILGYDGHWWLAGNAAVPGESRELTMYCRNVDCVSVNNNLVVELTFDERSQCSSVRERTRRGRILHFVPKEHLAIAIELSALGYHQPRGDDRASKSRRRLQFNTIARNYFAINLTTDPEPVGRYASGHNGRLRNLNFVAADLTLGYAFNSDQVPEIDLARKPDYCTDTRRACSPWVCRH
jgi:hypothetical protein